MAEAFNSFDDNSRYNYPESCDDFDDDDEEEVTAEDDDESYEEVTVTVDGEEESYEGGGSNVEISYSNRNIGDDISNYSGATERNLGDDTTQYSGFSNDVEAISDADEYDEEYLEEILADDVEEVSFSSSHSTTFEELHGGYNNNSFGDSRDGSRRDDTASTDRYYADDHSEQEASASSRRSYGMERRQRLRDDDSKLKSIDESSHYNYDDDDDSSSSSADEAKDPNASFRKSYRAMQSESFQREEPPKMPSRDARSIWSDGVSERSRGSRSSKASRKGTSSRGRRDMTRTSQGDRSRRSEPQWTGASAHSRTSVEYSEEGSQRSRSSVSSRRERGFDFDTHQSQERERLETVTVSTASDETTRESSIYEEIVVEDDSDGCDSIAVLGTMSGVGKSVVAAGICRILSNGGTKCAPFKAQHTGTRTSPALLPDLPRRDNLYNSFARRVQKPKKDDSGRHSVYSTSMHSPKEDQGWGQIGVEQSMQAEACKIIPRVEMNPLSFRYGGRNARDEDLCAMIVMGKQIIRETYGNFSKRVGALKSIVLDSHRSLAAVTGADIIVVQGAGSCSELNLMDGDIVNLPLVRCLQCPWLLVANDETGGVFAQVIGTKMCVTKRDWELCVGVIVNKVKGDVDEFASGMEMLEQMTRKPLFAIPYLDDWDIKKETGISIEEKLKWEKTGNNRNHNYSKNGKTNKSKKDKPVIVVVVYPHSTILNDFYPLMNDDRFSIEWRRKQLPKIYPSTTAVVLPDSRLPLLDLKWLHDSGWAEFLREHVAAGGTVLGLCGGYQMLGWDVKGENDTKQGIGLLPISSTVRPAACNHCDRIKFQLYPSGISVVGFEIDCGSSEVVLSDRNDALGLYQGLVPLLADENGKPEGMSLGHVRGTYIHGILRPAKARLELLVPKEDRKRFRSLIKNGSSVSPEDPLDKLATHLETCGLSHDRLCGMVFGENSSKEV